MSIRADIAANQLREALDKDGFIALYINFETGSAAIEQNSISQLDEVVQMLQSAPELKLEVAGHTDDVGTADTNLKLSEARARSVVEALVARSIDSGRLAPKGYGQSTPIADNRSDEGRAKNRRVELVKR